MKHKGLLLVGLLCLISLIFLTACQKQEQEFEKSFLAMDTLISVSVLSNDEALAEEALTAVENKYMEIDVLTDRFATGEDAQKSDICCINEAAGKNAVTVAPEVWEMISLSLDWNQKTDGAFNIALGPLMDLWGFGDNPTAPPTQSAIEQVLPLCNIDDVVTDQSNCSVYLKKRGMSLDLGGIAKGYATDKVIEVLKSYGIQNALINAGGNVYALGARASGDPWKVGVRNPRRSVDIIAKMDLSDLAVVTSADDQRYFIDDGKRYHHIMDPKTGYPANGHMSDTVVSASSTLADILSTSLFVMPQDKALALLQQISDVQGVLFVEPDGTIKITGDLEAFTELTGSKIVD